jgi:predicted DNA-binding transcriptional regulator YafY
MADDFSTQEQSHTLASRNKPFRTMLLALLLQVSWPTRLTAQQIVHQLPLYGKGKRPRALHRDLETLTDCQLKDLPVPDDPALEQWCAEQQGQGWLAISYDRRTGTFGLEHSAFSIEITEEEARAFVALQEGFTPGTPYASAVQMLLKRWAWLFSEKSQRLVAQKRKRRGRPVLLPLSPTEDYGKHTAVILALDKALEEGIYLSFAYTPLGQDWNSRPVLQATLEPYELEYRDGHWYFTAYVPEQSDFVDYRVDRIQPDSVTQTESRNRFTPGHRHRQGVKIRYWVSPMLARHGSLSARLRDQHIQLLDDGQGAIVEGYARSVWWARRLLLGYGAQVKALEPEQLVESLRTEIELMNQLYEREET